MVAVQISRSRRHIGVGRFHHENVNDVLATCINQCGGGAAREHVETTTEEGKIIRGEVADRGCKVNFAVEPRFTVC